MDLAKYHNLHTIIMLKDVIRKWWRSELTFADRTGTVLDWQRGDIRPPPNAFCRASLFSKEGFGRCCHSVSLLHQQFRASPGVRRACFQQCHFGFDMVGAPLYVAGEYEGFLFVEGFVREPLPAPAMKALQREILTLTEHPPDLGGDPVPLMERPEAEKLADLLEFAVNEIANYEAALRKKDQAIETLSQELSHRYKFENIVGNSAPMQEVFRVLERVAGSDATVLINGDSGTGKELVARAIHYNGPRKDKPFVAQNCSALNDNLLESALFGHTKGAFTGALRDSKGLFEVADGGTFFLDEVGDMSAALQLKLLRVLQEGTFTPVGSTTSKQVDVRVIAATHKDVSALVKKGTFREDLFYRINVIRIQVPPLRERRDDIPLLINHFLQKHRRETQTVRGIAPEALSLLIDYAWPGNIRELENEIERLLVLGSDLDLLPAELISSRIRESTRALDVLPLPLPGATQKLNQAVEYLEREMILRGLIRTGNNKSQLARELGISRSNLILKIQKYGLVNAGSDDGSEADA